MKKAAIHCLITICCFSAVFSQKTAAYKDAVTEILKAEDARRYDAVLEKSLSETPEDKYVVRALLAAGRIGDERAIPGIEHLLKDGSPKVREMAAFALGEIESLKAADAILTVLQSPGTPDTVRARAVEAAGKIAAANAGTANAPPESKNPKVVELGNAILDTLEAEEARREKQSKETVILGLTAALRARPEGSDTVVALFLTNLDPRIRAGAANTLARLRAKNANPALRGMLMSDADPIARANAARALGAAEDKEAVNMLIDAAAEDEDSRVRVSAIRSLAALRDPFAVERLLEHGEKLLSRVRTGSGSGRLPRKAPTSSNPAEKNELLEIATALGRLVPKTNDARTVRFLTALGEADRYRSPESEIAFARIAPKKYTEYLRAKKPEFKNTPAAVNAALQGIREFATLGSTDEEIMLKNEAIEQLRRGLKSYAERGQSPTEASVPEVLRSFAAFKPDGIDDILRRHLTENSVFIRATAADLMGDRPATKDNFDALKAAFTRALITDKVENDAQIGILDAMSRLDKRGCVGTLLVALSSPDYIVRKKALEILADKDLQKDFPGLPTSIENAHKNRKDQVLPYSPTFGTKLGQVLNTDADYKRALSRKNGSVKAVVTTQKGTFTIDLLPEDAPLTVDNFIKLARARFFNGLEVHRVVPNFVMQDGDPRGDGNGGPGWSIRCEINMVPFERGAVGMALSGKDTGGSQWFVTHSPQPHLDGGYTVFGKVNESGMKVVDRIVRGDKILSVRVLEGTSLSRPKKK
jgi:cyclophilin family peptidyl-prolyl cis-trans isomerase/HEAT repeat protein